MSESTFACVLLAELLALCLVWALDKANELRRCKNDRALAWRLHASALVRLAEERKLRRACRCLPSTSSTATGSPSDAPPAT